MNEEVNVKKYTAVCPRLVILKIILDLFKIKFYVYKRFNISHYSIVIHRKIKKGSIIMKKSNVITVLVCLIVTSLEVSMAQPGW